MRTYYRELRVHFVTWIFIQLYTETIASLFSQEPSVEKYINTKIGAKRYCNTVIHGDLTTTMYLRLKMVIF